MARLVPPDAGVSDQSEFYRTPGDSCPKDAMRNVWRNAGTDGRRQLGRRAGLRKAFATKLGDGPVNLLSVVGRAVQIVQGWGPETVVLGGTVATGGAPVPAPSSTGCVTIYRPDGSLQARLSDPDYASATAVAVCGDRLGKLTQFDGGSCSQRWAFVTYVDKNYGGSIGTKKISHVHVVVGSTIGVKYEVEDKVPGGAVGTGAVAIRATAVRFVGPYLLVAAGPYLYIFNAGGYTDSSSGYLARLNFDAWSWVIEGLAVSAARTGPNYTDVDASNAWCLAFGRGTYSISGIVSSTTNRQGSMIRSFVEMVRLILPAAGATSLPIPCYEVGKATFFAKAAATPPFPHSEGQLGWRPAEWLDGHGRVPMAGVIHPAIDRDQTGTTYSAAWGPGAVHLATTNEGYKDASTPPDGADGWWNLLTTRWETNAGLTSRDPVYTTRDVDSRKDDWQGTGYFNDLPWETDGDLPTGHLTPRPTIAAIDVQARFGEAYTTTNPDLGDLIVAGSFASGDNVRRLEATYLVSSATTATGATKWQFDCGAAVGTGGMAALWYPEAGHNYVAVVASRNNAWTGSASAFASVWLLDGSSGALKQSWDLGSGVDVYQCGFRADGSVLVAHEFVP